MDSKLILRNKNIRAKRPLTPKDILYTTYENNGVLQICFKSKGCSFYLAGLCLMCDYGKGTNLTKEELEKAFDMAIQESKEKINILLLNSYGSILDSNEISEECFLSLLNKVKNTNIKTIIFETHPKTITKEKLELIKSILKNKVIRFELGLETANSQIRKNNLLKDIDNAEFLKTVSLIHSFDMEVIVNLLVGIPFLTEKEQICDCINSIRWCIDNKIDEITLFPINVKPYTLLEELYNSNDYEIVSHWLLIEILNQLPVSYLPKIFIAWYGNRELKYYNNEHSILPISCSKCHDDLMIFYTKYLANNDENYRRKLLDNLIFNRQCNCYDKVLINIKK